MAIKKPQNDPHSKWRCKLNEANISRSVIKRSNATICTAFWSANDVEILSLMALIWSHETHCHRHESNKTTGNNPNLSCTYRYIYISVVHARARHTDRKTKSSFESIYFLLFLAENRIKMDEFGEEKTHICVRKTRCYRIDYDQYDNHELIWLNLLSATYFCSVFLCAVAGCVCIRLWISNFSFFTFNEK